MQLRDVSRMAMMMRLPITVPTIVLAAAAAAVAAVLVLSSSFTIFGYQLAYSQMTTPGSQNLSSLFKNFQATKRC
jgi:hypothetical protein